MAVQYGKRGTFNTTVGVKLDIDEAIVILPVDDVPLQRWVPSTPTDSIKVEWLEEDLTTQVVTVASVVGTASPWTLTVDDSAVLRPGDLLHLVDGPFDRQFRVTSINTGTNEAVVTSFAGTTDSNDPVAADKLEIIGQYRDEGTTPEEFRSNERTQAFNYTQILQEKVEETRTQQKRAMYGVTDPYGHQVMKKFKELGIRFEKTMIHGYRAISGDAKQRSMGGAFYYITDNAVSNTAANVKASINSLARLVYDDGGAARTLMVSPSVKAAISANIDPTLRRWETSEVVGGFVVEKVQTDFGTLELVVNRHFPKTKGILLQREFVQRKVFDGIFHELLAKVGDSQQGELVGELSLEVKNQKAHGVLTVTDA